MELIPQPRGNDGLPKRPFLRPGARVTRRQDGYLQVGLHRAWAVVLEDRPGVRTLLGRMAAGAPTGPDDAELEPVERARVLTKLAARSLIVDGDLLRSLTPVGGPVREAVAAAFAAYGDEAAPRLHQRIGARVSLRAPEPWHSTATALLEASGVGAVGAPPRPWPGALGPMDGADEPVCDGDVALLLYLQEADRAVTDGLMASDIPHLVLTVSEGRVVLGPFVAPGRTGCLRCADARASETDPRRPLVVAQYAEPRPGGAAVPDPVDPALLAMALAAAVREVVSWLDGDVPTSLSAQLEYDAGLTPQRTVVPRHPACGCSWSQIAEPVEEPAEPTVEAVTWAPIEELPAG